MAQMHIVGSLMESELDLWASFSLALSKGLSVCVCRCHFDKVISHRFAQVNNQPGWKLEGGQLKSLCFHKLNRCTDKNYGIWNHFHTEIPK